MRSLEVDDIDSSIMCVNTPFYAWLTTADQPIFIEAVRVYLDMGAYKQHPDLDGRAVNSLRNIHSAYYWAIHNQAMRERQQHG